MFINGIMYFLFYDHHYYLDHLTSVTSGVAPVLIIFNDFLAHNVSCLCLLLDEGDSLAPEMHCDIFFSFFMLESSRIIALIVLTLKVAIH